MISVKVRYLQLSQVTKEKEESFDLEAGSRYRDLRRAVIARHPSMTYVVAIALLDGAPANPDTELWEGAEVDLLASPAGG